jgi:hypothetical protein
VEGEWRESGGRVEGEWRESGGRGEGERRGEDLVVKEGDGQLVMGTLG